MPDDAVFLTKLMAVAHLPVLEDWMAFLPAPPARMVLYVPADPAVIAAARDFAEARPFPVQIFEARPGENLRQAETVILQRLLDGATERYAMLVNLDTLPFRRGEEGWYDEVIRGIEADPACVFFTATGRFHRADRPGIAPHLLRTQRFSNNFAIVELAFWRRAMTTWSMESVRGQGVERYHSEWALEQELTATGEYGLRRLASDSWRVFHVHQWGPELFVTREKFRAGRGTQAYAAKAFEDVRHEWQGYFNGPKPPLLFRARVALGAARRRWLG